MSDGESSPKKAPSKTEILSNIAAASDLNKKDVAKVIEALAAEIKKNLMAPVAPASSPSPVW